MLHYTKRNYRFWLISVVIVLLSVAILPAAAQDDAEDTADDGGRPASGVYELQRGDVLDVLAQRWDVSLEAIMQTNGFDSTTILSIGDRITVPPDAPPYGEYPAIVDDDTRGRGGGSGVSGDVYVVQPRDTLDFIGQRLDVSVVAIQQANLITNTTSLMPGMSLIIPDDAASYGMYPALQRDPEQSVDSSLGQGGGVVGEDQYVVQSNDTLDGIAAKHNVDTQCLAEFNSIDDARYVYPGDVIDINRTCPAYMGFDFVGDL